MKTLNVPAPEKYIRIFGDNAFEINVGNVLIPRGHILEEMKEMTQPRRDGWITVERFCLDIIIDKFPFDRFFQKTDAPRGLELTSGFGPWTRIRPSLHPNLAHIFKQRPGLVHPKYLRDEFNRPRSICYNEIKFRDSDGVPFWLCQQRYGEDMVEEFRPAPNEPFDVWKPIRLN